MTWLNFWSGILGVVAAVVGVWVWGFDGAVWATVVSAFVQWALTHVAVRSLARRDSIAIGLRGWWREQRVLWTFSLPAMAQGVMVAPVTWAASALLVNQPGGFAENGALSAANQWYGAVMFLPNALGSAIFPVLSERIGQKDLTGARKVLKAGVALNAAVVVPIILAGSIASPWIMGMYGKGFGGAWPVLVVVLVTSGVVAVTNPVGSVLAASGRVWLAFLMNSGWAAVFLGATVALVNRGALGVASARLIGYIVHAVWTFWFAVTFVRTRASAGEA
jgi:O-antigen/teichoic acid export membrane protein